MRAARDRSSSRLIHGAIVREKFQAARRLAVGEFGCSTSRVLQWQRPVLRMLEAGRKHKELELLPCRKQKQDQGLT